MINKFVPVKSQKGTRKKHLSKDALNKQAQTMESVQMMREQINRSRWIAEEISVTTTGNSINLSIQEGIVPLEWKISNVVPIFKNGNLCEPENYRSVSLTSVVCKLIEPLLRDHMVEFMNKHKLLNHSQRGFMKERFCLKRTY